MAEMWTKQNSVVTALLLGMAIRACFEEAVKFVGSVPKRALRAAQAALA